MNEFIGRYKKEIIATSIAIILALFSSYLGSLGEKLVDFIARISSRAADFIYAMASLDYPYLVTDQIASLLLVGMCTLCVMFFFELRRLARKIISMEEGKEIEDRSISKKLISKIKTEKKLGSAVNTILVLLLILPIMYYGIFILNFTVQRLNTVFKSDLRILSAYISDQEIKKLNSKWALMTSGKDYDEIMSEIKNYKQAHELPVR
jgi:hypothetical protein